MSITTPIKLNLHSIDNGFCRVYYRSGKDLLCYQESIGTSFALYVCSRDGEPSYSIDHKPYLPGTPSPEGESRVEGLFRSWLELTKESCLHESM